MNTNFIGTLVVTGYLAAGHIGSNGKVPRAGETCATDKRIPLGSTVLIEGLGKRKVTDHCNDRFHGARLDLPFETSWADARRFGTNHCRVWLVTK
jgi:3D (Asp-Asp-Asp) domain-containing protein